jgi:hypothetical protein
VDEVRRFMEGDEQSDSPMGKAIHNLVAGVAPVPAHNSK